MDSKSLRIKGYWDLIDKISAGIIILDENHKILHWNRWFQDRTHLKLNTSENKSFTEVFPDLEHARLHNAISDALEFGFPAIVSNVFNKTPFPLYNPINITIDQAKDHRLQQTINVSQINFSSDRNYCLIQINDITAAIAREKHLERHIKEKKDTEKLLLITEMRQRTIMNTMIDALIIFNKTGEIESFNPAAENYFAYTKDEIIGKNISLLIEEFSPVFNAKNPSQLVSKLSMVGSTHEDVGIRKNGDFFPIDLSISKMDLSEDTLYSAVIRDITDRKQMDKLKQDFITTVSHELRTPLTSIRGSLGLLCGGVFEGIPKKALDMLEIANNNCDRLIFLINDILDIEKVASGKMAFNMQRLNLKNLIETSITNNASYASQYNIIYQFSELSKNVFIHIDEHRFQQIMSNLLSNAAKFSKQGDKVDITIELKQNRVEIDIKDYGVGISEKFKNTIWLKFTQADTSTTRKVGGTGLGLAITKTLIEAMGGTVSFISKKDEGSTFQIRLPMA